MKNQFIANLHKHATFTENGAVSHSSTGSVLADQFGIAGSNRGRDIMSVFADQSILDNSVGSVVAIRFIFYLRSITRKPKGLWFSSENLLKGQGNKDESFKRYLWYLVNKPDAFYNNLWLFIVCGSYKDIWELITLAKIHNIRIDEEKIFEVYATALNENTIDDLAIKYLPQIVSNKKTKTDRSKLRNKIAKSFAEYLALDARAYRILKTTGKAHTWQQKISNRLFDQIDFGKISGKALSNLVSGKFLSKHSLESKYQAWILKQPVAKFTGYVYELMNNITYNLPFYKKITIDKQFDGLIQLFEKHEGGISGNVWCALDTSLSMSSKLTGTNTTAHNICLSLGIYFSTLNKGAFHKNVIMFDSKSRVKQLSGSFTDMVSQVPKNSMGDTNFQSVVDEIVRVRMANPTIPLEDYPQTLLVVSDMQFNPTGTAETNHEMQMRKLREVFPNEWVKDFKVIWWCCTGRVTNNKPSTIDEGGTYIFSGFDGSIISILLGEKSKNKLDGKTPTMEEVINEALSQEVFLQVKA